MMDEPEAWPTDVNGRDAGPAEATALGSGAVVILGGVEVSMPGKSVSESDGRCRLRNVGDGGPFWLAEDVVVSLAGTTVCLPFDRLVVLRSFGRTVA